MREIIKVRKVNSILQKSTDKIKYSIRHINNEVGWHQHLQSKKIGIVATSIALKFLNRMENEISEQDKAYNFIVNSQNPDGGWAYISNLPDNSNTESTCWALSALNIHREKYSEQIKKGKTWLLSKINMDLSDDSGWGFVGISNPRIYNTCLVLRTLSELNINSCEEYESGLNWLKTCQNRDGGWGEIKGSQSGLFYTSYVIVTLIKCGTNPNDNVILNAIKWLEQSIYQYGMDSPSSICTIEFIEEDINDKKSRTPFFHFTIPHIIQAFIISNNNTKRIVFDGILQLLESNCDGYWRHPFLEQSQLIPIWAIYDSIEAFLDFKEKNTDWEKIHHFRVWMNIIVKIRTYNPMRIWDKINPKLISFIITVLVIVLTILYFPKIKNIIPADKNKEYIDFGLSVLSSIIASIIIYIMIYLINPIFRNIRNKKN